MKNSIASRKRAEINAQNKSKYEAKLAEALSGANIVVPTSLLDAIETVVEYADNSELKEEFFEVVEPHLDYIASRLDITTNEAFMLSMAVNNGANCRLTLRELSQIFDCPRIKVLKYAQSLDSLVERKYMYIARQGDAELAYVLKYQAEDAIKRDEPYHYTALTGLTDEQLFEEIHNIQKLRSYRLLSFDHCLEEME